MRADHWRAAYQPPIGAPAIGLMFSHVFLGQGLFEYSLPVCYTELVDDNCEVCTSEVKRLKDNIHPKFHITTVTCACGESFETGSTRENIRVDICSKCHPFSTGVQRVVDAGGRVEKFRKKHNL